MRRSKSAFNDVPLPSLLQGTMNLCVELEKELQEANKRQQNATMKLEEQSRCVRNCQETVMQAALV